MKIWSKIKQFFEFWTPPTSLTPTPTLGRVVQEQEARASELIGQLVPIMGQARLGKFIKEKTSATILNGTTVGPAPGVLDFSLAEARFFRLPPPWLKLVERSLQNLIKDLEQLFAEETRGFKPVIPVTPEAKKMLSAIGIADVITRGVVQDVEKNLITKEKATLSVMVTASALRDEAGNVKGMVIAAKDLTEIKRLQQEKVQGLEDAQRV